MTLDQNHSEFETFMKRVYIEKKEGSYQQEARQLLFEIKEQLDLPNLNQLRILQCYDLDLISNSEFELAIKNVLSEAPLDQVSYQLKIEQHQTAFRVALLPGQFDQRSDSAAQCIQILTQKEAPRISWSQVFVLTGQLSKRDIQQVKGYLINPVESQEVPLGLPETLLPKIAPPLPVPTINGFIKKDKKELLNVKATLKLAMNLDDLQHCQVYFAKTAQRNPTLTELRLLDTYWSDHCRHTTFLTPLSSIEFETSPSNKIIEEAFFNYQQIRSNYYTESKASPITLMDLAIIAMKYLRKIGKLDNLEISEEINAASIVLPVTVKGQSADWLVMFKNETHNHPTEIEPFGGAATCLGGAIRDPLSGRAYVYQAMRVTGAADPRTPFSQTLEGKLSQRKICRGAAQGYSSYGNQIGIATGLVHEFYHPDYVAKRMEVGAVIAAAPKKNVVRGTPMPGDWIVLIGGHTGRDGIGGATGSSKEHDETALENAAEVQKGNPPTERKLQRLFRNPEFSQKIKRCNDFGAGGISVAIGELADSLEIDLDAVPKKYQGLDGTELTLSESQERMAIVINQEDYLKIQELALKENLDTAKVAEVTNSGRMRIHFQGRVIVDLLRKFIATNGVLQSQEVIISAPVHKNSPLQKNITVTNWVETWLKRCQYLNFSQQKGLIEQFDSSIGAASILQPLGGRTQSTQIEAMAAKIPVLEGETDCGTLMSFGFDPAISSWHPFYGGAYAVIESVCRIVASGGEYSDIRLTFQEYFEKLGNDPHKWGKPMSALLGAFTVQKALQIAAIGGKDSMSGTFGEINVPPTLISFAVAPISAEKVISPELKSTNSTLYRITTPRSSEGLPEWSSWIENLRWLTKEIHSGRILSAQSIRMGGIAEALTNMTAGNQIGVEISTLISPSELFKEGFGDFIIEIQGSIEPNIKSTHILKLGTTTTLPFIQFKDVELPLEKIEKSWNQSLESTYPTDATPTILNAVETYTFKGSPHIRTNNKIIQPKVCIPIFPGTNCEYDSAQAFTKQGATIITPVFQNLNSEQVDTSLKKLAKVIQESQILMLPGGFSAGDEPDGSGKFISNVFRNNQVADATMDLLNNRQGLILGICNGFQALIKLGLLPYGEIMEPEESMPTLTVNSISRHVARHVHTRISNNTSPWLQSCEIGEQHCIPVSHREGRFYATQKALRELVENQQIATQYVSPSGKASMAIEDNPNGSLGAIEGITNLDGRVLGKMGHSERIGNQIFKNIPGEKDQKIFASGVKYFK